MTSIALFGQPAAIDTAQDTLEQQAHTTGEAVEKLTPAQLEAGNFKQGHIKLFGVDFTIRTPRGHYGDYLALFGAKSVACKIAPYTHVAYPTTQSIRQGSLYGQSDPVPVLFGLRRDMDTVFAVSIGLSDRADTGKRWVLVIGADDAEDARSIAYMVLQDCLRNPAAIGDDGERGYWYLHESLELEPALLKSWMNDGLRNPEHLLKSENLLANLFAYQQGMPIDTAWQHDPERTANNARYLAFAYDDGQMTEALALDEAQDMTEGEGVSGVAMDALATPYKRLEQVLNRLLLPAMRSVAGDLQITDDVQLTQPKRLAGVLQIAALVTLSDGQTITIWFHNIDATPSKLSPDDPMTAWKWLLNKKNITVLVAPEGGKDLTIREIATRIMRMANKNSASFLKAQSKRTDLEQQLTALDEQILNGQQVLSDLDAEITELEQKETEQVQPEPDPQADVTQAAKPTDGQSDEVIRIAEMYAAELKMERVDEFHVKFARAVVDKDAYALRYLSNGLNDQGKRVFSAVTGITLPKQQGATWKAILEWAGVSEGQAALDDAQKDLAREELYLRKAISNFDFIQNEIKDIVSRGFNQLKKVGRETWLINSESQGFNLSKRGGKLNVTRPYLEAYLKALAAEAAVSPALAEQQPVTLTDPDTPNNPVVPADPVAPAASDSDNSHALDASYLFADAPTAFKDWLLPSVDKSESYNPYLSAVTIDKTAKSLGYDVRWLDNTGHVPMLTNMQLTGMIWKGDASSVKGYVTMGSDGKGLVFVNNGKGKKPTRVQLWSNRSKSNIDSFFTDNEELLADMVTILIKNDGVEPDTTAAAPTTEQLNQKAFEGVKNALSSTHGWSPRGHAPLEKSFSGVQVSGDLNPDGAVIVSIRSAGPLIIASIGNGMSEPITIWSEFLPQYNQNDAAYQATAKALNKNVEAYVQQKRTEMQGDTTTPTPEQINQQAFDGVANVLTADHGWVKRGSRLEKGFLGADLSDKYNPDGKLFISVRLEDSMIIATVPDGMGDLTTVGSELPPQGNQNDVAYQATATALNAKVEAYVQQKRSEFQPASDPAGSTNTPDGEFLQSVIDGLVDPLTIDMPHIVELADKYKEDPEMLTLVESALTVLSKAQLAADQGAAA